MVLICADCGYPVKSRYDGKFECVNNCNGGPCKNNCLTTGTLVSNELNGFKIIESDELNRFTAIFCKLVGV